MYEYLSSPSTTLKGINPYSRPKTWGIASAFSNCDDSIHPKKCFPHGPSFVADPHDPTRLEAQFHPPGP